MAKTAGATLYTSNQGSFAGMRWRFLYSGRGSARHHSGVSVCAGRAGAEKAMQATNAMRTFLSDCLILDDLFWRMFLDTWNATSLPSNTPFCLKQYIQGFRPIIPVIQPHPSIRQLAYRSRSRTG